MKPFNAIAALANNHHEFGEHGGVNMSIEASTTFTVMHARTLPEIFQGYKNPDHGGCYLYGRHFNPTVYALSRQLAAMEGSELAYCTASGISAIAAVIMQLCEPGDEIISARTIYGGTFALLNEFLPRKTGIQTRFVDITNLDEVRKAITDKTRIIYAESIANPTLRIANIPELAKIAHAHGAKLMIDNTFSPLMIAPIQLGADIVVHSMTKFINGASDIIAGAICANKSLIMELMDTKMGALMLLGPTMDPRVAFEISLRLPHLPMRMREHSQRALYFAQRLAALGLTVTYPGLINHPDHALLKTMQCSDYGFGGVFTLDLGTEEKANALMETLQNKYHFGYMAVSLGYFDTLMSCSSATTSSELSQEDQTSAGISHGLIRFSMGYTGTLEQRWQQMEHALKKIGIVV